MEHLQKLLRLPSRYLLLRGGGGGLVLRCSRELLLDIRGSRASTVLVDGLLCLVRILSSVVLEGLGSVTSVLGSKIADLRSLLSSQGAGPVELSIDDILVLDVDKRSEVGDGGSDQGKAPKRDEFDEEVGDEGRKESLAILVGTHFE